MSVMKPTPYQRAVLSVPEKYNMLLAGGRAGGKSTCLMFILLRHVQMYGNKAYALLVRESYEAIKQLEEQFELLVMQIYGPNVKIHNKTEHTFNFPSGAKVQFGQLAEQKDYVKYQGKSYTMLIVDEYGEISNPRWVTLLMSNLRGPKDIPIRTIWAANPGGAQHGFLHHGFIANSTPWEPFERNGSEWVCCPSNLVDNPHINHKQYEQALRDACGNDEELLKAWLSGDWNIARGAYFAGVLDERVHKLPSVKYPPTKLSSQWLPYLAMDWGSGAPCITYLIAESPGIEGFPKGSLLVLDELAVYDTTDQSLNTGLNWPPSKLAEAQRQMADKWGCPPEGVGDDAYGLEDTLLETLSEHGVYFVRPRKERVAGWQEMRNMFTAAKLRNGQPGLWVSARCEYFWRTVPFLQRDSKRPEDLITKGPDHGADACFVSGTPVITEHGTQAIETIQVGDKVLTRVGYRTVKAVGVRKAAVRKIELSDGNSLTGSLSHPILANGQWTSLADLKPGDKLLSWAEWTKYCTTELSIDDIQTLTDRSFEATSLQTERTAPTGWVDCIKRFGSSIMDRFLKAVTSITKMKTPLTTQLITWRALRLPNTCRNTCSPPNENSSHETAWARPDWPQQSGMAAPRDENSTVPWENTLTRLEFWSSLLASMTSALRRSVIRSLRQSIAATSASQRNADNRASIMRHECAVSVVGNSPVTSTTAFVGVEENVFNLEVEDCPEYFASGVLVHNCRYGVLHRGHGAFSGGVTGQF